MSKNYTNFSFDRATSSHLLYTDIEDNKVFVKKMSCKNMKLNFIDI